MLVGPRSRPASSLRSEEFGSKSVGKKRVDAVGKKRVDAVGMKRVDAVGKSRVDAARRKGLMQLG